MKKRKEITILNYTDNSTRFKASILALLFCLMIGSAFADLNEEEYKEGFFNTWKKSLDSIAFTTYGESQGCSVYPDEEKTLTFTNAEFKPLKDVFGSSSYGLVDVYMIIDNTKYYLKEKWVSENYYFVLAPGLNPQTYLLEFYNCPEPQEDKSIMTPDGYKHNDLICDHGVSVSRVICETGFCSDGVKYEEIFECESNTYCTSDINKCILASTDEERETHTGDIDEYSYKTVTETTAETLKLYDNVIEELDGKVYDETAINDNLREQQEEVLEELKKTIKEDSDRSDSPNEVPLSVIVSVVLGIFVCVGVLVLLVRK